MNETSTNLSQVPHKLLKNPDQSLAKWGAESGGWGCRRVQTGLGWRRQRGDRRWVQANHQGRNT